MTTGCSCMSACGLDWEADVGSALKYGLEVQRLGFECSQFASAATKAEGEASDQSESNGHLHPRVSSWKPSFSQ